MRLYHGGETIVKEPEIRVAGRTLDYGCGFYTTTSRSQAKLWVERKLRKSSVDIGYINVYEFDESAMSSMKSKVFADADERWLDFVMLNRTKKDYIHDYDIVYGPVANDRVYAAFALYEGGLLNKQELIAELKTYTLVDQYLFHTEKSLRCLQFIEATEVVYERRN